MDKLAIIIQDDLKTAGQLKQILSLSGFRVLIFSTAEDFLLAKKDDCRCLYLIELNLPGISGTELINLIRTKDKLSPLFIISASLDDKRVTEVLRNGADDFIFKPFNPEHLIIKLVNAFKKVEYLLDDQMSVGIKLIPEADLVMREGKVLRLTSKEYSIIEQLLKDPQKVHNRQELVQHIGSKDITSRTIDVHVSCLRKKLNSIFMEIETIRGRGYRIVIKTLTTAGW